MLKPFTRTDGQTVKDTLRIYREEIRSDKRRFFTGVILIPFGHFLYIVMLPLYLSFILQSLITNPKDLTTPLLLMGAMAVTSLVALFVNDIGFRKFFNHDEYITTRLTDRAMNTLLSHSHQFFADTKVGALAGDVFSFSRSYLAIMDSVMLQGSPIIVSFVTSLIIIAFLSPVLLIPLGLLTLFIVLHSAYSLEKRSVYRNQRKKMTSQLNGSIADIMGNQLLVRVFARSNEEIHQVMKERRAIEAVAGKEIKIVQDEANNRQAVLYTFQILTILACAWLFSQGQVSIAALVFAITYLGRITGSMFSITAVIRTIEQGFLDAAPITEILSRSTEVQDAPDAKDIRIKKGEIVFDQVYFGYSDNLNAEVFEELSLRIKPGQKVGLAGYSGGGKTTFTQLLLRFADINQGRILIDGQDISLVTQNSLRSNIAYVPQEPFLFHRSLRENISYGKPDATDKEIKEAARKANAMEFIDKLPKGMDTTVGERGIKLSGGQRQRIAIARAILKDAPILILDEATSALDSESERVIQDSLASLMEGRTSVVIAHRLSTIAKLDRIIVLDEGRIIEDGSHKELLAKDGVYAKLWSHQSGGFIEE